MPKKEKQRGKGSFVRMCAGCNGRKHKDGLIRVVRTAEGLAAVDPSGKLPGRGAYVCRDVKCLGILKKSGRLARLLRTEIPPALYDMLSAVAESGESDGS